MKCRVTLHTSYNLEGAPATAVDEAFAKLAEELKTRPIKEIFRWSYENPEQPELPKLFKKRWT